MEKTKDRLRKKITLDIYALSRKQKSLVDSINTLKIERSLLKSDIVDIKENNIILTEKLKEIKSRIKNASIHEIKEKTKVNLSIDDGKKRLFEISQKIKNNKGTIEYLKNKIFLLNEKNVKITERIVDNERILDGMKIKISRIKDEMENSERKREIKEKIIRELDGKIVVKSDDLDKIENKINVLIIRKNKFLLEIDKLNETSQKLLEQIEKNKEEKILEENVFNENIKKIQKEIKTAKKELNGIKEEITKSAKILLHMGEKEKMLKQKEETLREKYKSLRLEY